MSFISLWSECYSDLRNELLNVVQLKGAIGEHQTNIESREAIFSAIMASTDEEVINALAKFLKDAFSKREHIIGGN